MDQELRNRLRRLGVSRGTRDLKQPRRENSQKRGKSASSKTGKNEGIKLLEQLFPGGWLEETVYGACFIVDRIYPVTYEHGHDRLLSLLSHSPQSAAVFNKDTYRSSLTFRDFLFIDTETTGLGGAGTLAFMVGVAFFERSPSAEVLVVRQYFLRDHADETAMLLLLDDLLEQKAGLISFNGRTFDLPLLNNRYLMNRLPSRIHDVPHIDLLPPSRRLWRSRFGSVALGNLEKELLGVQRTEEDLPGWLIPTVYSDYLRSGNASEISRVFYHNQLDMLSMVTLAAEIIRQFSGSGADDHPTDLYSLGKWQAALGMNEEAETNLRLAISGNPPLKIYHQALKHLSVLLKRLNRREEAVLIWQQWASTSLDDVEAHIELAKHFEWQTKDLDHARTWTEQGLTLVNHWSPRRAAVIRPSLEHRLARLQRKIEALDQ